MEDDVEKLKKLSVKELDDLLGRCVSAVDAVNADDSLKGEGSGTATVSFGEDVTVGAASLSASGSDPEKLVDNTLVITDVNKESTITICSTTEVDNADTTHSVPIETILSEYSNHQTRMLLNTDSNTDELKSPFVLSNAFFTITFQANVELIKSSIIEFMKHVGSAKASAVGAERAEKKRRAIEEFERRAREKAAASGGSSPAVERGFLNGKKKSPSSSAAFKKLAVARAFATEMFTGKGKNFLVFFAGVGVMHFLGEELGLPRSV